MPFSGTAPFSGTRPISGTVPFTGGRPISGTVPFSGTRVFTGTGAAAGAVVGGVVTRTETAATVAGTGVLALRTPQVLAQFETSGQISKVNVVAGQTVKKGDVLAELDLSDLNEVLRKAKESLALKETEIATALEPASQSDIDNAAAQLGSAYASYTQLLQGADKYALESALRSWNQARNSLYSSQLNRDQACGLVPGIPGSNEASCKSAQLSVQQAEMREATAHQSYLDAQKPASNDQLVKSWSAVASAQNNLANLKNGVSAEKRHVYELQLKQLQVAVDRATRNLARAKLLSPCDCVVQAVTLTAGSTSEGNVTLLDTARLIFRATNITERDVIAIKPGQSATLRLKAFNDLFTGKVAAVLPASSGMQSSTALFTVLIDLDPSTANLLPGMTGSVDITIR